jgi:hypothetical protein
MKGFVKANGRSVIAVEKSGNTKVGQIAITYASQASCPSSCPLKDAGCYAELGRVGMVTHELNKSTASPLEVALEEAAAIRAMQTTRPLRLHGVGDCSTVETTKIVAEACEEYPGIVYTYTHAHRDVPRKNWLHVSVLASCESLDEAADAMERGYAAAVVVPEHESRGPKVVFDSQGRSMLLQPCPQQTTPGVTCNSCRLCMKDQRLLGQRRVIAFEAHGQRSRRVREMLKLKEVNNGQPV